jgi:hypothetical protein
MLKFVQLNEGWNADPNDPDPAVSSRGDAVELTFLLNAFEFSGVSEGEAGKLSFAGCQQWRLGATNDEGWYKGQCRYSGIAPHWGEFFELVGDDPRRLHPKDWQQTIHPSPRGRHFLFYLKDNTFECLAEDWSFHREPGEQQ